MATLSAAGKVLNKRQTDKQKAKTLKEIHFLINWLDESDLFLYDVVSSKTVVPPERMSIFDVTPGTICRVLFDSQYYRAKVIESGTKTTMNTKQKEMEESAKQGYSGDERESDYQPSESAKESYSDAEDGMHSACNTELLPKTKKMKRSSSNTPKSAFPSKPSATTAAKSLKLSKPQTINLLSGTDESISNKGKGKAPVTNKKVVDSANYEWQMRHFQTEPNQQNNSKQDDKVTGDDEKHQQCNEDMYYQLSKRINQLEAYDHQQTTANCADQLSKRVDKLEETVKKLKTKLKTQNWEIKELKGSHVLSCSTSSLGLEESQPEADIPGDGDNILISGHKVDRIKLQAAKLQPDAAKCALQLVSCLFNPGELANGNPSGLTNSKDEVRKRTLVKLDPIRMKYITDYIQEKWPTQGINQVLKKITQKCTDVYHNKKELRHV